MSDYSKVTDFASKDALNTGNPNKLVKGTEIDAEFEAIETAILTKYDSGDITNQATAEAGADNTQLMTPLRAEQHAVAWSLENAGAVYDLWQYADPNADKILFWDDSAGAVGSLTATPGTGGIGISGTDLALDLDTLLNVTPASGDAVVVTDVSDSGNPKTVLMSALTTYMEGTVNHDSLTGFVANEHIDHSGVSITAGTGLSGGGTIAASRTLNLDISGLSAMSLAPAGTDSFLYNDGGTMKQMNFNQIALPSRVTSSLASDFASTDCGTYVYWTGTSDGTLTMVPALGQDQTYIIVINLSGNGSVLTIAASGGAGIYSEGSRVKLRQYAVGVLIRYSSLVWVLGGGISA